MAGADRLRAPTLVKNLKWAFGLQMHISGFLFLCLTGCSSGEALVMIVNAANSETFCATCLLNYRCGENNNKKETDSNNKVENHAHTLT